MRLQRFSTLRDFERFSHNHLIPTSNDLPCMGRQIYCDIDQQPTNIPYGFINLFMLIDNYCGRSQLTDQVLPGLFLTNSLSSCRICETLYILEAGTLSECYYVLASQKELSYHAEIVVVHQCTQEHNKKTIAKV